MKNALKYIPWLMTLGFGIAVCCFFGLKYPYHLHYQEQYQLFQFTSEYFWETIALPGGLSDYVSRFFTQFYYYAWVGASILALLFCLIQRMTWHFFVYKNMVLYPFSFLPSIVLWAYYGDENALLTATISILFSQWMSLLVQYIRKPMMRQSLFLILIPFLYGALGSLSLLFILLMLHYEWRRKEGVSFFLLIGLTLLIAILCPLVAHHIVQFPLSRLILGLHYFRFHHMIPYWPWIAFLLAFLLPLLSNIPVGFKSRIQWMAFSLFFLLVGGSGWFLVKSNCHFGKEEAMKYDYMARMRMWNRMMMTADLDNPQSPMTVTCLNLALIKTGRMGDHMFEYFQNGPEGLLPKFVRDFTSPLPTSEVFYHIGMINTAQRYTFEVQEAIPDFQKSARAYKRLAETNLINGDYKVAQKYLHILQNTLYYKNWANEMMTLLWNEKAINNHPEYGWLRKIRLQRDFLFSEAEMDSMLGLLYSGEHQNRLAYEYLIAYTLLKKDLSRFMECYPLGQYLNYDHIPRSYQEALLLVWTQQHSDFRDLPWSIAPQTIKRMTDFMKAYTSKQTEAYMQMKFGDTYWYYYFYRYKS